MYYPDADKGVRGLAVACEIESRLNWSYFNGVTVKAELPFDKRTEQLKSTNKKLRSPQYIEYITHVRISKRRSWLSA